MNAIDLLKAQLEKRESLGLLRSLTREKDLIDFYSNDYLGIARVPFHDKADIPRGATGSRLISGNSNEAVLLEAELSDFHGFQAGLIFNSGYAANVGLFSALSTKNTVILYDELIHASARDGIRLGIGKSYSFRHNDLQDLKRLLEQNRGAICYVAVEALYSMDGDRVPLSELISLCEDYQANVIVDEAHSTGIIGEQGRGSVSESGLGSKVFASVYTFGKALGCHGAIVGGSEILKEYLVNFSRPFIYSTFLPPSEILKIRDSYSLMKNADDARSRLTELIELFRELTGSKASGPIHSFVFPGNEQVSKVAARFEAAGFAVKPIKSPTVKEGTERLRICLHSFNTETEIRELSLNLKEQLTSVC